MKPGNMVLALQSGTVCWNPPKKWDIPPTEGKERILSLRLNTAAGPATLLSVYARILTSAADPKDKFYDDLSTTFRNIPESHSLFIVGDCNARVVADHETWASCLGHFSVGRTNENGQRLLELYCHHNLCVTNAYFNTKPQHRVSWRHPRSKHWYQLDLILTRRSSLPCVRLTRGYQSVDCDTDHSLVCSKVKLQARRICRTRKAGRPRINTSYTRYPP